VKIALTSMLMTTRANLSVGPPFDLAVYRNGSLDVGEVRIEEDSPFLPALDAVWTKHLFNAMDDLPAVTLSDLED
jgi:putative proteasome-type protease